MSSTHPKPAWVFEPGRYPRSYETRIESYPLRRKAGLVLIVVGLAGLGDGVMHSVPSLALSGIALVLISLWMVAVRLQTIILYEDRIEIRRGKDVESRRRGDLLGWKYALESRQGAQKGKACWVLLVAKDDEVTPLMVQSNRPELDRDFANWVFSLPDLMAINALGAPHDLHLPTGGSTPVDMHK